MCSVLIYRKLENKVCNVFRGRKSFKLEESPLKSQWKINLDNCDETQDKTAFYVKPEGSSINCQIDLLPLVMCKFKKNQIKRICGRQLE